MLVRLWIKKKPSFIVGGNAKRYSYFGWQFGGSLKTKHTFYKVIQQSQSLVFTHKSWKYMCTQKPARGSFIHNCQKQEATKMPFSRWIDKQIVVHPENGIAFSTKKKWAIKLWKDIEELSVQFSSVAQSCPTLCDSMNGSTPGLPVHHQLLEFTQIYVHWVGDAIQPSHPLSSPSPPAPNPSLYQSLFQWVNSSHEVAKVLEFQLQHHSFQRNPRVDLL